MTQTVPLTPLGYQILEHWRRHRPRMVENLERAEKSKVVIARDPALRAAGGSADSGRVLKMLDRAMQSFYGGDSPADAWKKVARPGGVIGLKVNCLSGKGAATNPVLVEAICERLQQAGIPQKDIVIWDRLNSDLEKADIGRA